MSTLRISRHRRAIAVVTASVMIGWSVTLSHPPLATAGVSQPGAEGAPSDTVTAEPLPTWQINGVVWDQAIIGNTVIAVGEFTKTRPPFAAPGSAQERDVAHVFAYDITTGNPVPGYDIELNAQARTIELSPDKKTLYIGGDFTTVNGQTRRHLAAIDATTGTLNPRFRPVVGGPVRAIAPTNTIVYFGGDFNGVAGVIRKRLAAVNAADGALNTTWTPATDGRYVYAMALTPDQDKVIIGGSFATLNSQTAKGLAAVDPTQGTVLPWATSNKFGSYGDGAVVGLKTVDGKVYGAAWDFNAANGVFEGTFALRPEDGSPEWVNYCNGDTYDVFPMNGTAYSVSHVHDCPNLGGFAKRYYQYGLATSTRRTTPDGWTANNNEPGSQLRQWFPTFYPGTYTSSKQAGWSVIGNGEYLAVGGEFPSVGAMNQQGLVRFTTRKNAPRARSEGPQRDGSRPVAAMTAYGVRLEWTAAHDTDDSALTYEIFREGIAAPVGVVKGESTFWETPRMYWTDRSLEAGGTYTVTARDADGNTVTTPASAAITASPKATEAYAGAAARDGAAMFYGFNDSTGADEVGADKMTLASGQYGASGASGTANDFGVNVTSQGHSYGTTEQTAPNALTLETWVKTTRSGARLLGFGSNRTAYSAITDRHLYIDTDGRPRLGAYDTGSKQAVVGDTPINDGTWHHVVGVLGNDKMALYVDGIEVATQPTTNPASYRGYWRIGNDTIVGWPGAPAKDAVADTAVPIMTVDNVAIYRDTLSPNQIADHHRLGRGE